VEVGSSTNKRITIGNSASAVEGSTSSVTIGDEATMNGSGAIAIGRQAQVTNNSGISIGALSDAHTEQSTAIGYNAQAGLAGSGPVSNKHTVAVGAYASAQSSRSIAIGYTSLASGLEAIAIGHGSNATGSKSIMIGSGTNSTDESIKLGRDVNVDGVLSSRTHYFLATRGRYETSQLTFPTNSTTTVEWDHVDVDDNFGIVSTIGQQSTNVGYVAVPVDGIYMITAEIPFYLPQVPVMMYFQLTNSSGGSHPVYGTEEWGTTAGVSEANAYLTTSTSFVAKLSANDRIYLKVFNVSTTGTNYLQLATGNVGATFRAPAEIAVARMG